MLTENTTKEKRDSKKNVFGLDIQEMAKAGLHFGHRASRLHPKMGPYIFGVKSTIHIIDLEKTLTRFQQALEFISQLKKEGKILLLVGTRIQHKELIKEMANEYHFPYVVERWLGGTLTNLEVMQKRVNHLKELEAKKTGLEWEKYTKKERAQMEKELHDLDLKFGGLRDLQKLPDAIFICDMRKDKLAVKEARAKNILVVGICDTNVDPTLADYPIPANDDAISSVRYILEKVKKALGPEHS